MRDAPGTLVLLSLLALAFAAVPRPARAHPGHGDGISPATPPPPDALAVTQLVRTGSGADAYDTVPNWCQIPADRHGTLGPTHGGIVIDKTGKIYFSMDGGPTAIMVYSPDGKFLKGVGGKDLVGIHGLQIREEGGEEFIYAAHLAGKRALKLKLDGTIVWEIPFEKFKESGKYTDAKQFAPTAIAVGPDGRIFVADGYGQNWVHLFDKDRNYVKSFGGFGAEPGKFKTCHGLGLDTRSGKPLLLVCDRENLRLQHFDMDGNFVAVITENLRRPCSVSFHDDHVAIAELAGRVAIIDKTNKVVSVLGDNPDVKQRANFNVPPDQWKVGVFTAPHGVSYDKDQNLYVMDWNASGRVSRLNHVTGPSQQAKAD
jgi:DNA-binding beta-propeller fold protein YncE